MRRRCTECRQMFTVAASARATQRVCGSTCRRRRDRRLARQRRRDDLDDARTDERARQRASRARRAAEAATAASGCHAPPSAPKVLLSRQEVTDLVDRALARSRATLVRDFRGALGRYAAKSGESSSIRAESSSAHVVCSSRRSSRQSVRSFARGDPLRILLTSPAVRLSHR
jgi:hypothetical protein